eukprot:scpid80819/ scgid11388/ 
MSAAVTLCFLENVELADEVAGLNANVDETEALLKDYRSQLCNARKEIGRRERQSQDLEEELESVTAESKESRQALQNRLRHWRPIQLKTKADASVAERQDKVDDALSSRFTASPEENVALQKRKLPLCKQTPSIAAAPFSFETMADGSKYLPAVRQCCYLQLRSSRAKCRHFQYKKSDQHHSDNGWHVYGKTAISRPSFPDACGVEKRD